MLHDSKRQKFSTDELKEKLTAFSKADWLRLRKIAEYRCFPFKSDPDEILQIVISSALSEKGRKCPKDVDIFRFFDLALKSTVSNQLKARDRLAEVKPKDRKSVV